MEAARELLAAESEMAAYRSAVETLCNQLPAEKCKIATIEDDSLVVQVETANGVEAPDRRIPISDGELALAIRRGEAVVFDDVTDVRSTSSDTTTERHEFRSLIVVPFSESGLLLAAAEPADTFSEDHLALAKLVAAFLVATIERLHGTGSPRNGALLEEVASILSHDLQSPLAAATGTLELVRAEGDSERLETVATALIGSKR